MDSIVYSDSTLKEQRILQAKMQNESVVTSNLIEQNMKIVNSVKLETIAKGIFSFSETQQEQITQVAFQCPYIGGKSVYDARGLYALIDEEYFFDDDGICNSTGSQRLANPRIKDNDQIRVYPIPTRSIATIEYILDESKEYSLSITDALGRIVYINTINGSVNSKEIDMSLWRDGIYYYHITDNESEFYNGKISLVK
ncbi:MAG: T9SS type A sorting domain-containing protein [Bacteroidetes bacterium]|nr:T9SS type A sorting domain-containing protein [Bacteroidota bacterium]